MCLMPFITSSEQRYTELTWLHQNQKPFGTKYSRVDQVKFLKAVFQEALLDLSGTLN